MKQFITVVSGLFAIFCLILAIVDVFIWQSNVEAIYAGDAFVYWSHVGVFARLPLAIVMVVLVGIWLFTRQMSPVLNAIRWWAILMMSAACGLFSLIAPLNNINRSARHFETLRHNASVYHLYYQYSGIGDTTCDTVLVRCGSSGFICEHRYHGILTPVCFGEFTPVQLTLNDNAVQLIVNNTIIYTEISP